MVCIGTSGFRFDDWKGAFYPQELPAQRWLEYYAERFNCLEVNSTYYRLVHANTFAHMAEKTPPGFQFTVKAFGGLTHERGDTTAADFAAFSDSLQPLVEAHKFGCVLAQFPHSFHNTEENRRYLAEFTGRVGGLPTVVEFRGREWAQEAVFDFLRASGLGYCAVDEPQFRSLMPPLVEVTSPLGYVRFHGRNYRQWWAKDSKLRYDYLYSREELGEWVPKIQGLAKQTQKVYVFMNNCFQGQAATNAIELRDLLQGSGTTVV